MLDGIGQQLFGIGECMRSICLVQKTQCSAQVVSTLLIVQCLLTVLFAEFLPLTGGDYGEVGIAGRGVCQLLLQEYLPWRRVQQVRTTHHLSDALCGVIDNHRQLIGVQPIPTPHYEICQEFPQRTILWPLQ